jgi:hypothetical protein
MTQNDVAPITELGRIVGRFVGEEAKAKIMEGSEGIGDASAEEVATWLRGVMDRLDALVDEETRTQIMENMGLNCAQVNSSHIDTALAKRRQFETLEAFLEAEEKDPSKGSRIVREGDTIYQYYDPRAGFGVRCFCSLWRGLQDDQNASLTWCQCSKAFVAKLWEAYMGRPARVELIESSIAGAKECKFAVHLGSRER